MKWAKVLRTRRLDCGLSQQKVAAAARVSLATLQNIEAGRANPELATLDAICAALGLRLSIVPSPIEWDDFIAIGLPLMGDTASSEPKSSAQLLEVINRNAAAIAALVGQSREESALASWLWAISDHYPSVWRRIATPVRRWFDNLPKEATRIKLRRMALSRLREIL